MASFKKHSTGWEFRIRYKDPLSQTFKEKAQRGFETKKEAQIAAAELERKISEGFEQTDSSLADWLAIWLKEYKTGTVRKNTIELHTNNINKHIVPYFKKLPLQEFKPVMYQAFLNYLLQSGLSRRTVELIHSTLHNAMAKAVVLGKLEKNPCVGAEIKGQKSHKDIRFIESNRIADFLKAAMLYGYIYWIFFKVLIETGLRKGEAAALQLTDLDLDNCMISVTKTLDFNAKDGELLFGDPKTYNSKRTVRFSRSLSDVLRVHLDWIEQNKKTLGAIYRHDLNLLLCRPDGDIMPKSSLFNAFSRILKRVELPSLPIHSTRHTYAVLLLESGADMKFVQEQLGHGSIQITSDIYAHISKKIEDSNMDRFETYSESFLQ